MNQLSMSSLQSMHKRIKYEITENEDLIRHYSIFIRWYNKDAIPGTPEGLNNFRAMNGYKDVVRALKFKNKKLAQTSKEIKKTLRG